MGENDVRSMAAVNRFSMKTRTRGHCNGNVGRFEIVDGNKNSGCNNNLGLECLVEFS